MLSDLHVPAPLFHNLIIMPTYRDTSTSLALSSRNAYLSRDEKPWATVLVDALLEGKQRWVEMRGSENGVVEVKGVLDAARRSVQNVIERSRTQERGDGVEIRLIYIAMNDPEELFDLEAGEGQTGWVEKGRGAILSGAVMLGKTRLIDNLVFDYELNPSPPRLEQAE